MDIKKIKLEDLKPASYNPRIINDQQYNQLKENIKTFGLVDPIIINNKTNTIIGGHQRYKTLLEYNITELNELRLGDISWIFKDTNINIENENMEKALNLSLNKLSGEFDELKLEELINNLEDTDINMELTGFTEDEIEDYLIEEEVINTDIPLTDNEVELTEEIAEDIKVIKCPRCGYEIPK